MRLGLPILLSLIPSDRSHDDRPKAPDKSSDRPRQGSLPLTEDLPERKADRTLLAVKGSEPRRASAGSGRAQLPRAPSPQAAKEISFKDLETKYRALQQECSTTHEEYGAYNAKVQSWRTQAKAARQQDQRTIALLRGASQKEEDGGASTRDAAYQAGLEEQDDSVIFECLPESQDAELPFLASPTVRPFRVVVVRGTAVGPLPVHPQRAQVDLEKQENRAARIHRETQQRLPRDRAHARAIVQGLFAEAVEAARGREGFVAAPWREAMKAALVEIDASREGPSLQAGFKSTLSTISGMHLFDPKFDWRAPMGQDGQPRAVQSERDGSVPRRQSDARAVWDRAQNNARDLQASKDCGGRSGTSATFLAPFPIMEINA